MKARVARAGREHKEMMAAREERVAKAFERTAPKQRRAAIHPDDDHSKGLEEKFFYF